ncbi:putative NAD-specific glutamate dehydrogenase, partial [Candidatus Halobonum tyrrellensis G22]
TGTAGAGLRLARTLVHLLADLLELATQLLGRRLDLVGVGVLVGENLLDVVHRVAHVGFEVVVDVLLVLLEERLRALDRALGLVARLDPLAALLVLLGVLFGLRLHLLDLVVREARAALDRDLLGGARPLVLRGDVDDAVLVDVERHLDLRGARGRRRDAVELELAEQFVLLGDLAFALEHAHLHRGLVGRRGGEDLRLLGRDRGVLLDQPLEQPALHLDAERQRRHVQQDEVVDVAREHAALDRGAERDRLVGVDVLLGVDVQQFLDLLLDLRHPGGAADEDHLVDVPLVVAGVLERLLRRADRPVEQVARDRLERRARHLGLEVDRPRVGRRDERQVDRGLLAGAELDLRLLGGVLQPLERLPVLTEVDPVVVLELVGEVVDHRLVPVVAPEVVVAVGRDDLVDAAAQVEHAHVERPAAEVVHEDGLVRLVVETVRHRRRGRLVDDPVDLEAGDLAGVLRRLPLTVVEVRRHRDDGLRHLVAEVLLGVVLDLLEDHRRDLLGRVLLAVDLDGVVLLAHVPFDRTDRAFGVLDRLVLRRLPDESLVVVGERDHRRRRPVSLAVHDDLGFATLHDRERGVRRPQVDPQNLVARHC